MKKVVTIVIISLMSFLMMALGARATDGTESASSSLSTSEEIGVDDFGAPKSNFWNFWGLQVQRVLLRDEEKRAELAEKISAMRLQQITAANKNKREKTAQKALSRFEAEQAKIDELLTQTTDEKVRARLLARSAKNKILYTAFLDKIALNGAKFTDETNLAKLREQIMAKVAERLNQISLDEAERIMKESAEILEKKENLEEKKISKKLALMERLNRAKDKIGNDDDLTETTLEKALKERESEVETEIAKKDPQKIKKIIANMDDKYEKHLLILQSVYEKAPDSAKPALEKVINEQTGKIIERSAQDKELLGKIIDGKKDSSEMEKKITEKMKEVAKEKNINIDEAIKRREEVKTQKEEKIRELEGKKIELEKKKVEEKKKKLEEKTVEKIKNKTESVKEGEKESIKESVEKTKEKILGE